MENFFLFSLWQFRPPLVWLKCHYRDEYWHVEMIKVLSRTFQYKLKLVDFIALKVWWYARYREKILCTHIREFPFNFYPPRTLSILCCSCTMCHLSLFHYAIYCWLVSISDVKMCLFNTERCNGKQLMVKRYVEHSRESITNMPQASNHWIFYFALSTPNRAMSTFLYVKRIVGWICEKMVKILKYFNFF